MLLALIIAVCVMAIEWRLLSVFNVEDRVNVSPSSRLLPLWRLDSL